MPRFCTRESLRAQPDGLPLASERGARRSGLAEPHQRGQDTGEGDPRCWPPRPCHPLSPSRTGASPKARIPGWQARNPRDAFLILVETLLPCYLSFSSSPRVCNPVPPAVSTSSFLDASFRFFSLTPAGTVYPLPWTWKPTGRPLGRGSPKGASLQSSARLSHREHRAQAGGVLLSWASGLLTLGQKQP